MQLLTSMEDVDEADDALDKDTDTLASDAREQLAKLEHASPVDVHLAKLVRTLAERYEKQQESRAKLKHRVRVTRLASLSLLSSLRISYSHMLHAERDINSRLEVELNGSKSQSRMLSDMVSRASLSQEDERRVTPAKAEMLDEDVRRMPATSPAVAERNKLLADKRYLRQRVHDAEAQVARLESELQSLRPMLLRHPQEETPMVPARSPQAPRRPREAVMGDAKSEHLLLAARMLRTLRHATRPPRTRSPSSTAPDTSPSKYKTEALAEAPYTPRHRDAMYPTTPKSAMRPSIRTEEVPQSARSEPSAPLSGIDELLHAAQSLRGTEPPVAPNTLAPSHPTETHTYYATSSPVHTSPMRPWASGPMSAPMFGSPKRRRVSPQQMEVDEEHAYVPRASSDAEGLSALDVLADQAAAHEAPGLLKTADESVPPRAPPAGSAPPEARNDAPASVKPNAPATKPRTVGGNQSPEKRLPYVRWSAEEDTKLRRAIKEHGQRWEHVARAVGTRSYHQCRQRYLLMRRKEAAANGVPSPSKSTGGRTPTKAPARPTHAAHPSPFLNSSRDAAPGGEEEQGSSSSSSYESEAARPFPMIAQPQFTSPVRYERAIQHAHHRTSSSPQAFTHGRVGPVLYS